MNLSALFLFLNFLHMRLKKVHTSNNQAMLF